MRDRSRDDGDREGRGSVHLAPSRADARRTAESAATADAQRGLATTLRQGLPTTPAGLLALQRAAGNAAVSRAVTTQRHAADGAGHSCEEETAPTGGAPEPVQRRASVHGVLGSSGRPLPGPRRQDMEARFGGTDFGDVRIHDDAAARRSAREIGARAYTSGSHIVIGDGGGDRHTLAHELTHVVQQRKGPVAGTDHGDGLHMSDPSDRFELAAEENARKILSGPVPATAPTAGRHQRDEGQARHGAGMPDAVIQRAPGERLSARVLRRLRIANDAIRRVQADTRHAANQQAALIQTVYNSSLRAIVQQHDGFWDLSRIPPGTNRSELAAAKALHARSMICETAAACTFSYLRQRAAGEKLMMVMHPQQSHWFVIIGGENEDPSDWVVADPWPTQARAVEWKDHFCYSPGLENVFVDRKMRADGNDTARHLAHLIELNGAGRYAARWDLGRLDGRSNLEIGEMLQQAGVEMNLHQGDLAEQIMQGLAHVDRWPTDDIGTWPIEQLEVWCLAQIDEPIVRRLLARPESSGNYTDLRQEIAGGIGEVRQEQGDNSWIWDIHHTHAQERNQ